EVGLDGYHLTYFEMLGNFSFGQYFKEGAIDHAWEFVFEHMKLDPDRIWVSVFAGDPELGLGDDEVAIAHWEKREFPPERLVRAARILQQVDSVYDTDGFQEIMNWIAAQSGVAYGDSPEATKAHRILADHGRGMTFLAAEGVEPSNEGREYVMRRIVRRAVLQ